jgi:hypothetical protein
MRKLLLAALIPVSILLSQSNPGAIRGTVADDKGHAISGAIVTAQLRALPPSSKTAVTASDGSFQLTSLPAGPYVLCAQVTAGGYLDPCQWTATPPAATVAAAQVSVNITLPKGSIVKVRMQDANRQMSQKTKDGRQPHLLIGLPTPRGFSPAHLTHQDSAGSDFEVTVPFDTNLTMHVVSRDLKLGDGRGAPLANNAARDSFLQSSGDRGPKTFQYTVLGQLP